MRNKLLEAIKPLQLNTNDKNKLVNTIIDIGNSGGGVVTSEYAPRYFKIDWDKASEDWKIIIRGYTSNNYTYYTTCITNIIRLTLPNEDKNISIITTPMPFSNQISDFINYVIAFSYKPIISINSDTPDSKIITFEEQIEIINSKLGWKYNLTMEGITEITEEEFYKID